MKKALLLFTFALNALATTPTAIGNFDGVLFTSLMIRHPMSFEGGTISDCKEKRNNSSQEIYTCTLTGAKATVTATSGEKEIFNITKVVIIKSENMTYNYLVGSSKLQVGKREITVNVGGTLTQDATHPERITGYLTLSDAGINSYFEGYRR